MILIRQQLKDGQLVTVSCLSPIPAFEQLWSAQGLQTARATGSLDPKLKTLYQSLAVSLRSGSSISTAESVAPSSVSINSVSISSDSVDMRVCYSMLPLLLQHQQTGCSRAYSGWPTMSIRHFSQLCCFCSFHQSRLSSQQPYSCCCQHIMTLVIQTVSLQHQAVYPGVCVCTLCSGSPRFHLSTNVLQALGICLG